MESAQGVRNGKLDNLRALAIIIVVFGHSIILYSSSWNLYQTSFSIPALDHIKDGINLVQMPLFFSISGYLFNPKKKWNLLLIGKVKRLIIPYILIACLWMVPIRLLVGYPGYLNKSIAQIFLIDILGYHDNGHLWYLPCLFLCFVIAKLLCGAIRLLDSHSARIFFLIISGIASIYGSGIGHLLLKYTAMYFIWFYVGYLLQCYGKIISFSKKVWPACLIVSIVGFYYSSIRSGKFDILIVLVILLTLYAMMPEKTNGFTDFISKYSFGIYLFHSPLIYITFAYMADLNPVFVVTINLAIWGGLATLLSYLVSRTPFCIAIGMPFRKSK